MESGILALSFDIFLDEKEYKDSDFAKKYFEYKKCHIRCKLGDEMFCEVYLKTDLDKKGRCKMQYLSIADFAEIAGK